MSRLTAARRELALSSVINLPPHSYLLKFRVFPEPEDADRDVCLLQRRGGFEAAEEMRNKWVSFVPSPNRTLFAFRGVTDCVLTLSLNRGAAREGRSPET